MAYTTPNFRTKKALRLALADGQPIEVWQPNADLTGATIPANGTVSLEGPHYPEAHRWYAEGTMVNGRLVKVS